MQELDMNWEVSIPEDDEIVWCDEGTDGAVPPDEFEYSDEQLWPDGDPMVWDAENEQYRHEEFNYDYQDWHQMVEDLGLENLPF